MPFQGAHPMMMASLQHAAFQVGSDTCHLKLGNKHSAAFRLQSSLNPLHFPGNALLLTVHHRTRYLQQGMTSFLVPQLVSTRFLAGQSYRLF